MGRKRSSSSLASTTSNTTTMQDQELDTMYDYLAKVILIGPSGTGKSCLLHRFLKNEWRVLSSQTIGVEFASKIVRVGTGPRKKRVKLQLWDTAGTERFRSVSRSYYRGAAGALLVYDVSSRASFAGLATFLDDARALASPHLVTILAGNKADISEESTGAGAGSLLDSPVLDPAEASVRTNGTYLSTRPSTSQTSISSKTNWGLGTRNTATVAPEGREVSAQEASTWASEHGIPVAVEVSALSGENVAEVFEKLARVILTKIELGEIDPDDPQSGIQYGTDMSAWYEPGSVRSDASGVRRRRRGGAAPLDILSGSSVRRRGCC